MRLLLVALASGCAAVAAPKTSEPARAAAPAAPAASATGSASSPLRDPPGPPDERQAPKTLRLSQSGLAFASHRDELSRAVAQVLGGHQELNRTAVMFEQFASLCGCTGQPLEVELEPKLETWRVFSVLGLLEVAGFSRFRLFSGSDSALIAVGERGACSECAKAEFSAMETVQFDDWWLGVTTLAQASPKQPLFVSLASAPQAPYPVPKPSPFSTMPTIINPIRIQQRIRAQYGSLYRCLKKYPDVQTGEQASFRIQIAPTGVANSVKSEHVRAGTEPLAACVSSALQSMIFQAPSDGRTATILYPFKL